MSAVREPEKPFGMRVKETKKAISDAINNSNLPLIILINILKEHMYILNDIQMQQDLADEEEYNEKMKNYRELLSKKQ